MKKVITVVLVLLLCMSQGASLAFAVGEDPASDPAAVPAGDPASEGTEANDSTAVTYATSEDYRSKSFAELFKSGELVLPEDSPVKAKETPDSGGIMLQGTSGDLTALKLELKDKLNFDENAVGRVTVNMLAAKRVKATFNVFVDDEEEPAASLPLKADMGKNSWKRDGTITKSVLEKNIRSEHKISFTITISNLDDTDKTSVLLRSIEFAESSIPVMYFNIDESLGTVEAMNSDPEHDTECYGDVDLEIPENFRSEFTDKELGSVKGMELEYVRGRGNSTWGNDKNPYKVKFAKKQDLLGMGKNKHWVLLANRYDNSLIRNRITYWLTRKLGKDTGVFAPDCVPVEVVMNGDYYGSYLLTEQIRVAKERVNIDDLEEDDGPSATAEPEISGGYLLSKEYDDSSAQSLETARGSNFYIESPDFTEGPHTEEAKTTQQKYISDYLQKTEEAIFGDGFKDPSGKSYAEYLDVPAAIDFWWIQEFTENGDAYGGGSTYLYKERDKTDAEGNVTETGKLFWGPLWDFDYVAWGDLDYSATPEETFDYTSDSWMNRLRSDEDFAGKLVDRWKALDPLIEDLVKKGGIIDQYADEVRISEQYDVAKYGFYGEGGGYGYDYYDYDRVEPAGQDDPSEAEDTVHTYDQEIELLRTWTERRRDYVNSKGTIDNLMRKPLTVTFKAGKNVIAVRTYQPDDEIGKLPSAPKKKGYTFTGWVDEDGFEINPSDTVTVSMTATARYMKNSKVVKPKDIFFREKNIYTYNYHYNDYNENERQEIYPEYTLMPKNARGKIKWSSSNTKVGTVDEDGIVTIYGIGKTKITATLPSGKTNSYTVHVLDNDEMLSSIESISFKKKSIGLKTGQYTQLQVDLSPAPYYSGDFKWISSDTSIVSVDQNGVVTAKAPGKCSVVLYDLDEGRIRLCQIKVTATRAWKIKNARKKSTTVKARALKGNKVRLTWKRAKGVSGYYIYKASKKNGKYKKIASVRKAKTVKWTKKLASRKRLRKTYFKVRPFTKIGRKTYTGKWSNAVKTM